ncbi:MAG: P-loop NTPase [Spirochaetaceae bacterium]|nr:P-loop NTPase [Myxococcales bacterium]MCB9726402.1 P-loop NTPase [Spirochaetaceae bacterium]HPG25072.1 P-loop NTPase [Myxococcota bacterium]
MTTIVTVASGKGGVGKSVTVSNLGLALAARGRKVVVADLDLGGSNLATLFGAFEEGPDLGSFLSRDVSSLADVMRPLRRDLWLIAGAGETLATANPNWGMKQRLLRQLRKLPADVVLVDVGAGAGAHALDFFNAGDLRIVVTVPEPTASVDAYRFIKLATVREAVTRVSSRDPGRRVLERRDFHRASELWTTLGAEPGDEAATPRAAAPWVVVNQATDARRHFERLQIVTRRFLARELRLLGEIPRDPAVAEAVGAFLPVVESQPSSPAARAFVELARRVDDELIRHGIARRDGPVESPLPRVAASASTRPELPAGRRAAFPPPPSAG